MKSDEAQRLQDTVKVAAGWCLQRLDMREGGFGKNHEHSDSERAALHVAHSIAMSEIGRLQKIVDGR